MTIYVTHSSSFDYRRQLYQPLRESALNQEHTIALPHEDSDQQFDSKAYLKTCDLVVAEVSYPSTGQGIELGWADMYGLPIVCFYQQGRSFSNSLRVVSSDFIEYGDKSDMVEKLRVVIIDIINR